MENVDREVKALLELQAQIEGRFDELGFVGTEDARGNISHHLAELALFCRKFDKEIFPAFLRLPPQKRDELGDVVVGLNHDLWELREGLSDMESALVELMNYITR
jgi:hypothetical protein